MTAGLAEAAVPDTPVNPAIADPPAVAGVVGDDPLAAAPPANNE